MNTKIICIGLPKTGTTSLHFALTRLGYNSVHYPLGLLTHSSNLISMKLAINEFYRKSIRFLGLKKIPILKNKRFFVFKNLYSKTNKLTINLNYLSKYDAFSDLPICYTYKQIDNKFNDIKFICTIRDKDSWLESNKKHFSRNLNSKYSLQEQLRYSFYGQIEYDEEVWSDKFDKFYHDVDQYFKNREKDILILNITENEGYEKVCPFLKTTIINEKFPKKNQYPKKGA